MLPLRMLGPLMLMILLCDADSKCPNELNPLTLHPPEVIEEYEETVLVNCTSTAEEHAGMYWRTTGKPDSDIEDELSFTSLSVSLSDWNLTAECIIKLNDSHECSRHLEFTVYRNPKEVNIIPINTNPVVEGTQYELQCDVINVGPIKNLNVTWYKDDQIFWTESFTNTNKTVGEESSTLTFNISRRENGAQFKCKAQLDLGPHGLQTPQVSEMHQVFVHYAPEPKNKMYIENAFVTLGDDVTLKCEAEGNPPPDFHWTSDGGNILAKGNNLKIIRVKTNATYNCISSNYLGNTTKQIHVHVIKTEAPTVMNIPEAPTPRDCPLTLSPDEIVVRFGDPVSINCSTSATDVATMGWEASIGGTGSVAPPAVILKVEKLEQWVMEPQCYANLNDDHQCTLIPNITVYKTPDSVSVSAWDHGPMVEGTEYLLICDIINVAPVQKLKVNWYRGNEIVHSQKYTGTGVGLVNESSTLSVIPERNYSATLFRCEAELHLGPKGRELVPKAASPPYTAVVHYKPQLNCSGHYVGVEHEFSLGMLDCHADGNPLPTVQWYHQGEPISASEPLNRTHSGKYTADVVNHLGNSSTRVDITIEYGPSFNCNDHYEIEEDGKLQKCEPQGMPKPSITWFKDGEEMPSPQHWTKHDSGEYSLKATNKHGTATHVLHVEVLYGPVFKEGNYIKEVTLGENVTFDCLAEGNPLPVTHWNYTSAVNVRETTGRRQKNISVTGATSTNAGVYICVASNGVGHKTRSVTLMMKENATAGLSSLLLWLIILVIIVIVILTIFILRDYWKKHGQYSFVPGKAKDGPDIPMTNPAEHA